MSAGEYSVCQYFEDGSAQKAVAVLYRAHKEENRTIQREADKRMDAHYRIGKKG